MPDPSAALVPVSTERQVSFPEHDATTAAFVRSIAERFGDEVAVVHGDRRVTYAELERRSADLAKGLLATGAGKGTKVAMLWPNSAEFLVQLMAITRIGGVAVLCNTFSTGRELAQVLARAGVSHVHTVDRFLGHDYAARLGEAIPGLAAHRTSDIRTPALPSLRRIRIWTADDDVPPWAEPGTRSIEAARAAHPDVDEAFLAAAEASVAPADPAIVIFSSGATAEPKAVVHAQGALVRHPHNLLPYFEVLGDDVLYCAMPLFWVGGLVFTAMCALHVGARLVFEDRFDVDTTLGLIEREGVTQFRGWPDLGKQLAGHPEFFERGRSIRQRTFDMERPEDRPDRPDLISNSLGMSETLGPHMTEVSGTLLPEDKKGSFGRSVPGTRHRVVDPETGAPVGPGEHGEICVRGYSLMLGLIGRERSEVFDADGWYHTGDGGWYDADGHIYFTGRLGEAIKTKGANVSPREVEMVAQAFPEVLHVAVVGLPHPDRGEDVAAAVVARPGQTVDPPAFVGRLRRELSSYKVPAYVAVLEEQELPWLDSQKINRRAVIDLLVERFPDR